MGIEFTTCRYRLDPADRISSVDGWWLAFAKENGAPDLVEAAILGRSIWDFISGEATRRLYEEIHDLVRLSSHPAVVPLRCDSPSVRREIQLTISSDDEGYLTYDSMLVRAKLQPHLGLLDPTQRRSATTLTMCSCCKRALLESVGWLGVEEASARLRVSELTELPQLAYTVCPACTREMKDACQGVA